LVRTEGARLGLAHAAASEPHATPALADERLIVQRRRSQDHSPSREHERRRTEDGEAPDHPPQDDREARHGETQYGEARNGETSHREAWRPQDHGSAQEHWALDGEAHDAPQLHDTQEAPVSKGRY
jgi:hypothetical protein